MGGDRRRRQAKGANWDKRLGAAPLPVDLQHPRPSGYTRDQRTTQSARRAEVHYDTQTSDLSTLLLSMRLSEGLGASETPTPTLPATRTTRGRPAAASSSTLPPEPLGVVNRAGSPASPAREAAEAVLGLRNPGGKFRYAANGEVGPRVSWWVEVGD
jgi:hypothetical protein